MKIVKSIPKHGSNAVGIVEGQSYKLFIARALPVQQCSLKAVRTDNESVKRFSNLILKSI